MRNVMSKTREPDLMTLVGKTNKDLIFTKSTNSMTISRLLNLQINITNNKIKRQVLERDLEDIITFMREEYQYD